MNKATESIIENIKNDIFTDVDLANILHGTSSRRYALVKRMIASGDIIHIRRGLYCLTQKYQRDQMNLFSLAQRVYGPSYVSFESALSYHGWIPEAVYTVTSASMKKSKDFQTSLGDFNFKRIPTPEFFSFVERIEVSKQHVFFMAHPFKALLDYIYVNKKDWKSPTPAMKSLRIERESFEALSSDDFEALLGQYKNHRLQRFIKGVRKELGV